MYTKSLRQGFQSYYACASSFAADYIRFVYPHAKVAPKLKTKFPGAKHLAAATDAGAAFNFNGAESVSLPLSEHEDCAPLRELAAVQR